MTSIACVFLSSVLCISLYNNNNNNAALGHKLWKSALGHGELANYTEADLRNEVHQGDAVTYELGTPKYEILSDDKPEIITPDHPEYFEQLRKYGGLDSNEQELYERSKLNRNSTVTSNDKHESYHADKDAQQQHHQKQQTHQVSVKKIQLKSGGILIQPHEKSEDHKQQIDQQKHHQNESHNRIQKDDQQRQNKEQQPHNTHLLQLQLQHHEQHDHAKLQQHHQHAEVNINRHQQSQFNQPQDQSNSIESKEKNISSSSSMSSASASSEESSSKVKFVIVKSKSPNSKNATTAATSPRTAATSDVLTQLETTQPLLDEANQHDRQVLSNIWRSLRIRKL